jgi:hypothetical protein
MDLSRNLDAFANGADFAIFPSLPRRVYNAYNFYCLETGYVAGIAKPGGMPIEVLGLDGWIVTQPTYRIITEGVKLIQSDESIPTKIFPYTMDLDMVSAYPSCTIVANVSGRTTATEILEIEGKTLDEFRNHNINLTLGKANSFDYGVEMLNLPDFMTLRKSVKAKYA